MSRTYMDPKEIEKTSMELIEREIGGFKCPDKEREIIKRIIHTTVDVEFGKSTIFHPQAIDEGIKAIRNGKAIITDVNMVKAGIREYELAKYGNQVLCFITKDKNSAVEDLSIPRAVQGIRRAISYMDGTIIAIGNAPTALFEAIDIVKEGKARPALIVGVPVGFVGAYDSKEELLTVNVPYITHKSRKGGSAVASAIVNALIRLAALH